MTTRSHRSAWAFLASLLLAAVGCSGGGSDADSTPTLGNLHVSRTQAFWNEGGGTVQISGSVDFTDGGGDLAAMHLTSPAGDHIDVPISGAGGQKSGTLMATLVVDTTTVGHYTFEVYATDGGNRRSNTLSGTFDIVPDDTGTAWTVRTLPLPAESIFLHRVRWLDGAFIAAGTNLLTSPDGISWTAGPAGSFEDVAWTGTQLVAVGYPNVVTSPDAVTWTPSTLPAANQGQVHGIAASPARMVAVGTEVGLDFYSTTIPLIATSTDGVTWTKLPQTFSADLRSIVWSGTQFVAVGTRLGESLAAGIALTSPDGLTWTATTIDVVSTLKDVAWNGVRFVAVGYPWGVTSTDGITWERSGVAILGSEDAIAWSGTRFLACGVVTCATSTDGLQWQTNIQPGLTMVNGVAWGGTRWVAVGVTNGIAAVATSP